MHALPRGEPIHLGSGALTLLQEPASLRRIEHANHADCVGDRRQQRQDLGTEHHQFPIISMQRTRRQALDQRASGLEADADQGMADRTTCEGLVGLPA